MLRTRRVPLFVDPDDTNAITISMTSNRQTVKPTKPPILPDIPFPVLSSDETDELLTTARNGLEVGTEPPAKIELLGQAFSNGALPGSWKL